MKTTSFIVGGLLVIAACTLMQFRSEGFQGDMSGNAVPEMPLPDVSNGADEMKGKMGGFGVNGGESAFGVVPDMFGSKKGFDLSGNAPVNTSKMLQFSMVNLNVVDVSGAMPTITPLPTGYQLSVPVPASTPVSNGVYGAIQDRNIPPPAPIPAGSPAIAQGTQYNATMPDLTRYNAGYGGNGS